MMTSQQVHYLAGIWEGEGCFLTSIVGTPIVQCINTDRDVMEKYGNLVRRPVRGPYRGLKSTKDAWEVKVYCAEAINLMRMLLPLMGNRRGGKIREVLAFWEDRLLREQHKKDRKAVCHPERKLYHSSGLCSNCYKVPRNRARRERQRMENKIG